MFVFLWELFEALELDPWKNAFFKQSVSFLPKQRNISFAVVFEIKSTANIYCSQLLIHLIFWWWQQYYSHFLIWLVSSLIWCATKKSVVNFSPTNVREVFILTSKSWTSLQVVVTKLWIWRGHWPEIDWNTLLKGLCILNIYVLINKSQLNCNVNSKFLKNAGSIVYALLEVFVGSSHEYTTCGFTGLCRSMYRVFTIFINGRKYQKRSSEKDSLKISKLGLLALIIYSHVKNRTQHAKINDCFSNRTIIEYRVSQCSILGPLLFNINVINMLYWYKDSEIKNADNTSPYFTATDIPTVNYKLQVTSTKHFNWFDDIWELSSKTPQVVSISGTTITSSIAETLLGIMIDSELNFENHLNSICNKVSRKINALGHIIINCCLWVNVEFWCKYLPNAV